jgi:ribose-phosphate pyrophosphokinase
MIKLRANGIEVPFEVSKFPDGTSQLWKAGRLDLFSHFRINFIWENDEREVFHLLMLIDLIRSYNPDAFIYLAMPYLPYARQDKPVVSEFTFALNTFANLLNSKNIDLIESFDVHSNQAHKLIKNFHSISPQNFHNWVYSKFKPDLFFYPDRGAAYRYAAAINEIMLFGNKVRNQSTGEITDYEIANLNHFDIKDKKILIIDDICDGGATFITAAKKLKEHGAGEIGLCVSHGLFSKGFDEMKAAGISQFFTTNSLLKNSDGYKVWE